MTHAPCEEKAFLANAYSMMGQCQGMVGKMKELREICCHPSEACRSQPGCPAVVGRTHGSSCQEGLKSANEALKISEEADDRRGQAGGKRPMRARLWISGQGFRC